MIKRIFGALFVSCAAMVLAPQAVSAARINFTPSSVSMTEGQSQVVQVTLDQPIICQDIEVPCQVSIAVSTNAPSRTTITTSPIVVPFNQWFQTFNFTIMAVNDELVNGDVNPIVTAIATSGSEYYSNFAPTFSLTILDNDVAQEAPQDEGESSGTPATTDNNDATLAPTGQNQTLFIALAMLAISWTVTVVVRE